VTNLAAPELRRVAARHACPVERALAIVGAKWTLLILHNLMDRPRRFGELERLIEGASPKMLTARLRELEQLGLVSRTVYAEVPPRVEYRLTDAGASLRPIIDSLAEWGERLKPSRSK
jgi:DNA-binding HxlR family transcriptional regulator